MIVLQNFDVKGTLNIPEKHLVIDWFLLQPFWWPGSSSLPPLYPLPPRHRSHSCYPAVYPDGALHLWGTIHHLDSLDFMSWQVALHTAVVPVWGFFGVNYSKEHSLEVPRGDWGLSCQVGHGDGGWKSRRRSSLAGPRRFLYWNTFGSKSVVVSRGMRSIASWNRTQISCGTWRGGAGAFAR